MVKILDSTYDMADLEQFAANATHMDADERTKIIVLLKYFEYLFGGTLGEWDTEPTVLELNAVSKPFNCKHYPVPRINKETPRKELK